MRTEVAMLTNACCLQLVVGQQFLPLIHFTSRKMFALKICWKTTDTSRLT